jgi:hypothetical protein
MQRHRLGSSGSGTKRENIACWTDGLGPEVYQPCNSTCSFQPPPIDPICKKFWGSIGGIAKFQVLLYQNVFKAFQVGAWRDHTVRVRRAGRPDVACYPVEGAGGHGWCEAKVKHVSNQLTTERWGFCSYHCHLPGVQHTTTLMETSVNIFPTEMCIKFPGILKPPVFFKKKSELCGGRDIKPNQRIVNFSFQNGEFKVEDPPLEPDEDRGPQIGGGDSCNGDSGGPLIR